MEVTIDETGLSIASTEAAVSSPVTKFIDWEESGGVIDLTEENFDVK